MIKKTVEFELKYKEAAKNADELGKIVQKQDEKIKGLQGTLDKTKASTDKASKGFTKFSTSLKNIGKVSGIVFLVTQAFEILKETFQGNQKVMDAFNIGMEALSLAFNDLFNYLNDNVGTVIEYFKAIFSDPQQALKDLGVAIKKNIIERLNSSLEVFGYLGTAIKKVFQGDWEGAMEAAKNAGKEYVDVLTGVDGSFDKIKENVSSASESILAYGKSTLKSAKEIVELNKASEMSAVINQGLIEKYDRQAEQQRQIRDEERNTIQDRVDANNKLNEILDEQESLMLKNVDLQIKAAQAQYAKNDSDANAIALLEAKNEKASIESQIEGFRSEQKSNDLALDRESLELTQSKTDAEAELNIASLQFNADQILGEYAKLLAIKEVADKEYQINLKRLNDKKALYKEGTMAFQEAQNEIDQLNQDFSQQEVEIDKQTTSAKMDLASNAMGDLASIFGEESKAGKAAAIAQTSIETFKGATSAFSSLAGIPIVGPVLGGIAAAAAVAAGIANVKKIASIGPSVPSGGGSVPSVPQAPRFNVVGASETNQLAQAIGEKETKPVKAFVVSNDVTNAQALDRNIVEGASIG
tara:strand:- start:334 stop:2088 length:1755 start_codon:yes stop_codon:yes gene_type:complete